MAEKVAQSGLEARHIAAAYARGKENGIRNLLNMKFNGKVRVTCNTNVVEKLINYMSTL